MQALWIFYTNQNIIICRKQSQGQGEIKKSTQPILTSIVFCTLKLKFSISLKEIIKWKLLKQIVSLNLSRALCL